MAGNGRNKEAEHERQAVSQYYIRKDNPIYLFIYLENGYGKGARKTLNSVFAPFYGLDHFPTFQECSSSDKDGVVKRNQETFFHEAVFQQRIEVSTEIFLLEANDRGKVQRFPKCTHGR